jgi:GT2 family glycosyltransferase
VPTDSGLSISVVIPHYDQLPLLERLLEALERQDIRRDFEVIVADDGSGASHDPGQLSPRGFHLIRCRHEGPAAARNAGARAAGGDVLAFTDADCLPRAQWLRSITEHYAQHPECSATTGPLIDATRPRRLAFLHRFFRRTCEADLRPQVFDYAGVDMLGMIGANLTVRTIDFRRIEGFDVAFPVPGGEDYDLAFRLQASGCHAYFIPDAEVEHHYPADVASLLKRWTTYGFGKETFSMKHGIPRQTLHLLEPGRPSARAFVNMTRAHFGIGTAWVTASPLIAVLCFQRGAARARSVLAERLP